MVNRELSLKVYLKIQFCFIIYAPPNPCPQFLDYIPGYVWVEGGLPHRTAKESNYFHHLKQVYCDLEQVGVLGC